jgi:hypothetical protein
MKLRRWAVVATFATAFPMFAQAPEDKLPVKAADQLPVKPGVVLKPLVIGRKTFPVAPQKTGCFKHTRGSTAWTEVPCLTPAQKANIPHPDSIGILTEQPGTSSPGTPEGGEMEVNFVALGGVTDSKNGAGMFSLQLNTNGFKGNGDKPGDTNWVQFTYQQFSPTLLRNNPNILCIWSIDLSTQNYTGTGPSCIAVTIFRGAQTGDIATITGSVSNGQLQLGATIPWATGSGESDPDAFLVTSPDYRNFGGSPWTSVNGGLLGSGGSSQAALTRSCITATPSLWYERPPSGSTFQTNFLLSGVTGESNNLTNSNTPIASCAADGVCSASQHGVSADWYKTDGVKTCYASDVPVGRLPDENPASATEDDSTVYTANGNHIRMCKNNALLIGIDVADSRFLCSATMPPANQLTVDKSTKGIYFYNDKTGVIRAPMLHSVHVCPADFAMVGWDQAKDLLLCGEILPSGYVPVNQALFGKDSVNGPGGTQVPEPNFPKQNLHSCDPKGSGDPDAVVGIDVTNNVLVCRNSISVARLQ